MIRSRRPALLSIAVDSNSIATFNYQHLHKQGVKQKGGNSKEILTTTCF